MLREARVISNTERPTRLISGDNVDSASTKSGRSGIYPPGFDMNELTNFPNIRACKFVILLF